MKKFLALLLVLMLCSVSTAMTETAYPGDTVNVTLSVTSNSGNAAIATVGFSYDASVLEYVGASGLGTATAPGGASGSFTIYNLNGIPTGGFGTLTFKVKANATPGTYYVTASTSEALTNGFEPVSLGVSGGSITIVQKPCDTHVWNDGVVTTTATCTTNGSKTYTCTVCGTTKQEPLSATGHAYQTATVNATCAADGSVTTTCENCDYSDVQVLPATGAHTWNNGITTAATCTAEGKTIYTCMVCGTAKQDSLPATGHAYQTVTVNATCTLDGSVTTTCTNCDYSDVQVLPATGHSLDNGTVTKYPSCTKSGTKVYACTADGCDYTETQMLSPLGHDYETWYVVKSVTDDTPGMEQRVCKRCGADQTRDVLTYTDLHVNAHMAGIYFSDVTELTEGTEMFAVVDLSVESETTYALVADNTYVIGTVTVAVAQGQVTVSYALVSDEIVVAEEFMTILPGLQDMTSLDRETMTAYAFNKAINIEEALGGNTTALLYIHNDCQFRSDVVGLSYFMTDAAHTEMVDAMMEKIGLE